MPKKPFLPPLLPPKLDFTPVFAKIIRARDIIARYDEAVKRLPNPEIIQRSFETKEAVLSSKIEGTQVTVDEVLMFDAQNTRTEENEKEKDYREVINYRHAIKHGKDLLRKKPLAENVIKELHKLLLSSVRGQSSRPGEFRDSQVFIGPYGATVEQALFIPPEPQHIVKLFANLEGYLHDENVLDPLIQIGIAHYQFEAIHPFVDGNGRVGRLLVPLSLYEKGVTTFPNIYVSEFLEEHRDVYYTLLREVSEKEAWIPWISFFLDAVYEQTKVSVERVSKIELLHMQLRSKMPELGSIYSNQLLDALFIKPRFTVKTIRECAKISNSQTLYTLIEKFVKAGIIVDASPKRDRNKIYAFTELIKIIR